MIPQHLGMFAFVLHTSVAVLEYKCLQNVWVWITIDIIEYNPSTETNFNKHWHTHKDDMDNINKETLNAVGQTLLEVIYNE